MRDPGQLFPISRQHLEVLTDHVGILQHAIGSWPDPAHGYCVDDVARALQVDLLHGRTLGWAAVKDSAERGLRFLGEAFEPTGGRFRNFRAIDGAWIGGLGSDDSYGRAMLALGQASATPPDDRLGDIARALFDRALPAARDLTSPRAEASVVLGCAAILDSDPGGRPAAMLELLAHRLHDRFRRHATPDWPWPEVTMTYENALLPHALIVAGRVLASESMTNAGLDTLDWLIDAQTSPDGHLSPVGNGWWLRGDEMSQFDQQPIEATSLLLAAESVYAATGGAHYLAAMERSYAWFLGVNDLGIDMADPVRGACRDGLTRTGVNVNEGAESTLMWLMAAEHIRAVRSAPMRRIAPRPELLATSTR